MLANRLGLASIEKNLDIGGDTLLRACSEAMTAYFRKNTLGMFDKAPVFVVHPRTLEEILEEMGIKTIDKIFGFGVYSNKVIPYKYIAFGVAGTQED